MWFLIILIFVIVIIIIITIVFIYKKNKKEPEPMRPLADWVGIWYSEKSDTPVFEIIYTDALYVDPVDGNKFIPYIENNSFLFNNITYKLVGAKIEKYAGSDYGGNLYKKY